MGSLVALTGFCNKRLIGNSSLTHIESVPPFTSICEAFAA